MKIPNYFIIKILEDFNSLQNDMEYLKGTNTMVRDDGEWYSVLNTTDIIPKEITKKMYDFSCVKEYE